jgi:hypothetical protein
LGTPPSKPGFGRAFSFGDISNPVASRHEQSKEHRPRGLIDFDTVSSGPTLFAMPVHPVEFDVPPRLRDWVSSHVGAIGINGLDGGGKTTFALGVQSFLRDQNREACLLHVDDFNNDEVQDEVYEAFACGELTAAHLGPSDS